MSSFLISNRGAIALERWTNTSGPGKESDMKKIFVLATAVFFGVLILFSAHVTIHVGISLGLLPVTGQTIPFMSSGGSHLVLEFALLGIVTSLARHGRGATRDVSANEYLGG